MTSVFVYESYTETIIYRILFNILKQRDTAAIPWKSGNIHTNVLFSTDTHGDQYYDNRRSCKINPERFGIYQNHPMLRFSWNIVIKLYI